MQRLPWMRVAPIPIVALALAAACDRNIERFDPNERPRSPDLSKIFPEGAESAEPVTPRLPPPPGTDDDAASLAQAGTEGEAPIAGRIELAPEFADRAAPDAVLFLVARGNGGGPPLAVQRIPSPRFPLEFSIGPEDRMIQGVPFAGPILLSARLDGDGDATSRSPGDLQGAAAAPVEPGATGVVVRLDTEL